MPWSRKVPAENDNENQQQLGRRDPETLRMPRGLKYAWGVGVTVLLALSLAVDRNSAWLPLINRAIDILQQQNAPIENR